jgi:two-component system sensor histidine kinase HydH
VLKLSILTSKKTFWFLLTILILVGIFVFLGVRSKEQWEGVVVKTFNRQQLAIAQSIAGRLENYFTAATQNLQLCTSLHFKDITQKPQDVLAEVAMFRVGRITLLYPSGAKEIINSAGIKRHTEFTDREKEYLSLHRGKRTYVSDTYEAEPTTPRKWVVDIVTSHNSTAVVWTIDVLKICHEVTAGVRSGRTGYAWIINNQGYLLAHIDKAFLGENAFLARALKYPALSFTRINTLQKEHLLTGKEGTSWYTSGWHMGEKKDPIKKLLAYTPAFYAGPASKNRFFAVAVSAPIDEVKGLVREPVIYQWLLMGIALFILGTLAGYVFYTEWRWAYALKKEVDRKAEELKGIHEELLRSERLTAMGSAVAYVAHEIKNPLMVIGGFSQQLMRGLEKDDKTKKKLQIIISETKRLEDFLKDIGQFAKDPEPQKRMINLSELIEEVTDFFKSGLEDHKIAVNVNLTRLPIYISADPEQIKQVLLNIIKNAIEAMPESGSLTIKSHKDQEATIEINDTGAGISQETLPKVSTPFFTTRPGGTGLGLSICHKIIAAHQGTISICSEGVNKGTTVVIRLPRILNQRSWKWEL